MPDYEGFYRSRLLELKGSGNQRTARCPFCKHKNDFSVNIETGQCKCFRCRFEGDAFSFLQELEGVGFKEAKGKLAKWGIKPFMEKQTARKAMIIKQTAKVNYEKMAGLAREYAKQLSGENRIYLREVRGLSDEVIKKYEIGFCRRHPKYPKDGCERLSIPISKDGGIVNIRFHAIGETKEGTPKDLPYQRDLPYATWLFPEGQLKNDVVWLCEGEPDTLSAISHGLSAITVTGGASSWRKEFTPLFKNKKVYIVYDCDEAGRKGAKKIARVLRNVAQVKVVDLGLNEGEDTTDWFGTYGKNAKELQELAGKTSWNHKENEREKKERKPKRISITGRQLLEEPIVEPVAPIGKGFLVPERYTILAASDGEGKTTLCTQLALSVITGTTFLGLFPIPKPTKFLYFCGENSRRDIKEKIGFQRIEIERILGRNIINDLEDRLILVEPININFFLSEGGKSELYGWLEDHRPEVVIFDPLANFISGSHSLSDDRLARTTAKILTGIAQEFKCYPILTTHFKKKAIDEKTGRSLATLDDAWEMVHGSKYWLNPAASQIVIVRANRQRYPKAKKIGFKFKTVTELEPMQVLRNHNLWYEELKPDEINKAKLTPEDVKDILKRKFANERALPSTLEEEAARELGCSRRQIRELIKLGKKAGLFHRNKNGEIESLGDEGQRKLLDS